MIHDGVDGFIDTDVGRLVAVMDELLADPGLLAWPGGWAAPGGAWPGSGRHPPVRP